MKAVVTAIFEKKYIYISILFFFTSKISAQNDTIFFNSEWKTTVKDSAVYYRLKPVRIKTKKEFRPYIPSIDSLYIIKDYYLKNDKIQFKSYAQDYNGKSLIGIAEWYDENGNKYKTENHYYNHFTPKIAIPNWPILYLDYRIAAKSQFTGGLEVGVNCSDYNEKRLFIGLGYGITPYKGTYYGVPDLHLSYNVGGLLFLKAGSSNRNAYALTGISFLNFLDLGFGYSKQYNKEKTPVIQGFTFSTTIRLTKNSDTYQKIKVL